MRTSRSAPPIDDWKSALTRNTSSWNTRLGVCAVERLQLFKFEVFHAGIIANVLIQTRDCYVVWGSYQASMAGVHVDLIVRDTCRLRPGIVGLSENVNVISIVGRFLEHSRIYYFRNGGDEQYYIGSADCMTRNLTGRVETIAPIEDPALMAELRTYLDLQLADRRSAWDMQPDGSYLQRVPEHEGQISAQEALIVRAQRLGRRTS